MSGYLLFADQLDSKMIICKTGYQKYITQRSKISLEIVRNIGPKSYSINNDIKNSAKSRMLHHIYNIISHHYI